MTETYLVRFGCLRPLFSNDRSGSEGAGRLCVFIPVVQAAEKFAESGRFAFHTNNDCEGLVCGSTAIGPGLTEADLYRILGPR